MEGSTYLGHVLAEGTRIAESAEGSLEAPVPSCPGNTVGSLLIHTAGFCLVVSSGLRGEENDWSSFGSDPLAAHRREHARLVDDLGARDPEEPCWAWGSDQRVRFWYRRSAHELSVHRWDVENAVGEQSPIDAHLAADGIDELLVEFGPHNDACATDGAAEMFGGSGEMLHLHATDLPEVGEWLVVAHPDRFEVRREHAKGDVAAKGTASDLLLFLWGRVPPDRLEVFGDASLLDRWQERVKI